ncbi:MAG TPA: cytochrome c family protein [Stellaceae bacterium]|nr:cytochrome c family protein [Stellaceae bacterium]
MARSVLVVAVVAASSLLIALPARAQNAENGQKAFKQQCGLCHDVAAGKNRVGPSLFGVVGRKAGGADGFHYSDGNKNSGLTWDQATLDKYLADPRATVPGTTMTYAGLKNDEQRKDIIAYLATLH